MARLQGGKIPGTMKSGRQKAKPLAEDDDETIAITTIEGEGPPSGRTNQPTHLGPPLQMANSGQVKNACPLRSAGN